MRIGGLKKPSAPFGLTSISASFNGALCYVLEDLNTKGYCIPYADDILIMSYGTLKEHCYLLLEIVKRFVQYGIKISLNKSYFAVEKFIYLGFQFTEDGVTLTEERKKALLDFDPPKSVKGVQRFLGAMNYISAWFPMLASHLAGISNLINSNPFEWTKEHQSQFDRIKAILKSNLKLSYYDRRKPLFLFTDSSRLGGGGVLFQKKGPPPENKLDVLNQLPPLGTSATEDNFSIIREMQTGLSNPSYEPIYFISKKYSRGEVLQYSSLEKEILSLLFCITKIKYILGAASPIYVLTDAKNLLWLIKSAQVSSNPRLNRICTKLSLVPLHFVVFYVKPNIAGLYMADFLSRKFEVVEEIRKVPLKQIREVVPSDVKHDLKGIYTFQDIVREMNDHPDWVSFPCEMLEKHLPLVSQGLNPEFETVNALSEPFTKRELKGQYPFSPEFLITKSDFMVGQSEDTEMQKIIQKLTLAQKNDSLSGMLEFSDYKLWEGLLCHSKKPVRSVGITHSSPSFLICIPESMISLVIGTLHILMGHAGAIHVYRVIKANYHFSDMKGRVFGLVDPCHGCQLNLPRRTRKQPITPYLGISFPMSILAMDFFQMEMSKRKNKCLIILDIYSSYIFLFALANEKAEGVIASLNTLFANHGPPLGIKSDNGQSLLRSAKVQEFLEGWGVINTYLSLPHSVSHNPQCERMISSCRLIFKKLASATQVEWVDALPRAMAILNSTARLYPDGKLLSPFAKFFGRPPPKHIYDAECLFPHQGNIPYSRYKNMLEEVNKEMARLKKAFAAQKNAKARRYLEVGDLVLYRDLSTPQAGMRAKKTLPCYLNRLFVIRDLDGLQASVEEVSTGVTILVSADHLKRYKTHEDYVADLPKHLREQIGFPLGNFSFVDRKDLIQRLVKCGFEVNKYIPLKPDIPPRKRGPQSLPEIPKEKSGVPRWQPRQVKTTPEEKRKESKRSGSQISKIPEEPVDSSGKVISRVSSAQNDSESPPLSEAGKSDPGEYVAQPAIQPSSLNSQPQSETPKRKLRPRKLLAGAYRRLAGKRS